MSSNATTVSPQLDLNSSKFSKDIGNSYIDAFYFIISTIVAVLSLVAVAGNSLVLAAIWKTPSLRTPSYIPLAGLAFSDFCTGLISQPFYIANIYLFYFFGGQTQMKAFDMNSWPTSYLATRMVGDGCALFCFILTVLMITLMSIERWLHMSRRSLVTMRRTCVVVAALLPLPIPLVVYHFIANYGEASTGLATLVLFCIIFTSLAYFKIFRIIRHHQQQVQASELFQNAAQPAINFAKYKKSVFTILCILAIFYTGYLPFAISIILVAVFDLTDWTLLLFNVTVVLSFLSSSLNPLLYIWRIKDIRNEVARLVKGIFRKSN